MHLGVDLKNMRRALMRIQFDILGPPAPDVLFIRKMIVHKERLVRRKPQFLQRHLNHSCVCVVRVEIDNDQKIVPLNIGDQHIARYIAKPDVPSRLKGLVFFSDLINQGNDLAK
jgi:hypothetical protein